MNAFVQIYLIRFIYSHFRGRVQNISCKKLTMIIFRLKGPNQNSSMVIYHQQIINAIS